MANICEVCGRGQVSGNNVSHSHKKTRRKWNINFQTVRTTTENGTPVKLKVCTKCIKAGKVQRV
jgi:large subunit ribosomal protein L28